MSTTLLDMEYVVDDDDFGSILDAWAQRWEQEFKRLSEAEDRHLAKVAEQVHHMAGQDRHMREAATQFSMEGKSLRAKAESVMAERIGQVEQEQKEAKLREEAEKARKDACKDALQDSDDLVNQLLSGSSQRRQAAEAKRREERKAREAEQEARWKREKQERQQQQAPPGPSASSGSSGGPRFTRVPGASAQAAADLPSGRKADLSSPREFEAAWVKFENLLTSGHAITYNDIPWPPASSTVSGVSIKDNKNERKTKLRAAVLRWHPDKWQPVLDKVVEAERQKVVQKVQEVTRRILDERQRFSS